MQDGRARRRPMAARAAMGLVFALCVSQAGCAEGDADVLVKAAMDIYSQAGQPSVSVSSREWYYAYRYDMWHGAYAGEPYTVLESGSPAFSVRDLSSAALYAGPVASAGHGGLAASCTSELGGDDALPMIGAVPEDASVPGWEHNRAYPGMTDGDVFRQAPLSPGSGGPKALATCYAWTAGLSPLYSEALGYARSHGAVLCRVTAVYDGDGAMPEGFLFECQAFDGGLSRCCYVYNVQPGVAFDYGTGENWIEAAGGPGGG